MKKHCNKPFSPAKFPFFYGWIILAAGTIGILMSIPGQTMGVSVFTENLLTDLEINRNNLSLAYLVGTMGSGLLITRAGKYYDRYGARIMAFISGAMLGLMLLYLTRIDRVVNSMQKWEWVSPVLATFLLLAFGFWGIRFFGQGLLTMVSRNMVMKWFNKRRGLANAVLGIFVAFGFSLAPQVLNQFIEKLEWRGAWVLLAVIVGVVFAIFVLLFYRDNPEDCGCVADGKKNTGKKSKRPPSLPDRDYSLSEAKKTVAFWAFTLALALTALYISGLTFHVVSVFETSGMSKAKALGIFVPTSIIAVVVQFACGYVSDFIRLKYLLVFFMVGMLITTLGLTMLGDQSTAYWLIISGNGIVWGLYTVLIGVTWPRFYGLKNLGAISGFSMSLTVIGSALGPYLFSVSSDVSGSYDPVAWLCVIISVLLLLLAFKAENPNEPAIV
ncbi:MAG: MFS transporter [Bacteroidales bacterium]|nr:MFS transporter [Bacteroidales bacterium]